MSQVIISLKPRYAKLVLSGNKTVELRNRRVRLKPGTLVWLYATRPMACIVGVAEVESVVHANPAEIWRRFGEDIGMGAALFRRRSREVQEGLRAAWQELLDPAKAG